MIVKDTEQNQHAGTFVDWHLKLWGEAIDADKATLLPMPEESDDSEHDVIAASTTTVAAVSTTPIPPPQSTQDLPVSVPSDHPERPTKNPEPTPANDENATQTHVAQETTTSASSSWVSWLPSFGASKKVWIYGAAGLIGAFCCGLGIYFWVARRRRLRNDPRNTYEFELIDEEEAEGLNSGEKNVASKKGRRTRGGELYDAFAGGSDDDDEYDNYRDRSADRLAGVEPEHFGVGADSDDEESDDDEKGEAKPLSGPR